MTPLRDHRTGGPRSRSGTSGAPPRRGGPPVWLAWGAIFVTAILVTGSLTAYAAYRKLYGNITHEHVQDRLGKRPPKVGKSINVLVLGSDSRKGRAAKYGKAEGERSDTLILLHLSPGGKKAIGMSFPRDSIVQIPRCKSAKGGMSPAHTGMVNEAFSEGGPACAWKTIESLTGVRVDHFVKVDFSGFKGMVNALGGVQICLPKAVNDPDSKLNLPAGRHLVKGEQALAYVRNRHGLGDGSDLSRIKRQQLFMAAIVNKITGGDLLTSPSKLYNFLDAATSSITTDDDLDISEIRKLAESVKGMNAGKVKFVTVPNEPYPADPNRVQFKQPLADQLFDSVKNDNDLDKAGSGHQDKPKSKPTVPAKKVKVRVLNGTGTPGKAGEVATALRAQGFQVVGVGNSTRSGVATTTLRYGASGKKAMPTLRATLKSVTPQSARSVRTSTLDLVIGADWGGLKSAGVPKHLGGVKGDTNICENDAS